MATQIQQGDYVSFNIPEPYARDRTMTVVGMVVGVKEGGLFSPATLAIACNGSIYHRNEIDCVLCNKELLGIVVKECGELFKKSITQSLMPENE